ncbi:hypothetical protein JKF63_03387 [Porcisia hertigi]|uniref:Uncharacterized protein n=1 Tax=Porcisia hertigi TaxID=2761500 RepID=A0A836IAI8_9TRYP|nr:hypothetical protein JKF63_03387 [Porcisia hertigi]
MSTDSRTRTGAANAPFSVTDAQCLRREGARAGRARGGEDVSVYRVEVPTSSSTLPPSPKDRTDGRHGDVAAREGDAFPLPECGDGGPTPEAAADAAPLHVPLLTSVEEQQPRGPASRIPTMVLLRHRMGCSTVVLKPRQRKLYNRQNLENFVLYKEQKYNAVNVLWRFCILMLFLLSFSAFCLVFSACTTEWLSLHTGKLFLSTGLFFSCRDRFLRPCKSWRSSYMEWAVMEPSTGSTLCRASAAFVRRYVGVLWALGLFQILCEVTVLFLGLRIAARPTRSGALLLLCIGFLLSTSAGIATVVLFRFYTSCLRRTCEDEYAREGICRVEYGYGYRLHIGAIAVHGLLLVLALCMHSYIYNIRLKSREKLRKARHRVSHKAQTDDCSVRMLDLPTTAAFGGDAGSANVCTNWDVTEPAALLSKKNSSMQPSIASDGSGSAAATVSRNGVPVPANSRINREPYEGGGGRLRDVSVPYGHSTTPQSAVPGLEVPCTAAMSFNQKGAHPIRGNDKVDSAVAVAPMPTRESSFFQHGSLHVSFAGVPDEKDERGGGTGLPGSRSHRYRYRRWASTNSLDNVCTRTAAATAEESDAVHQNTEGTIVARDHVFGVPAADNSDGGDRHGGSWRGSSPGGALAPRGGRSRWTGSQTATAQPSVTPRGRQRRSRSGKRGATPAHQRARKHRSLFLRFFNREYDSNYLTAAELGVPIAGATDWVYDDRSDMYYSFDRNMFWDPLTKEYYNCILKSWQESPDQVLEVRDVLDYMLESPPSSAGRGQGGS